MGVSLPDLSFLEGAPEQNCTPRLSPHISSALLVLLGEGGEGPALLSLQQNLPRSVFRGVGLFVRIPQQIQCWREFMLVHATSPLALSFLPCPHSRIPAFLGVLDMSGHSFPAPRHWGPSPLWDCPVCLSLPLSPSWYLLPLLPSSLCGSLTCPELTSE